MEIRQLEYLVAVAEEASFTRAAQRVRISQSGVSAQVRQLERELGASLFDRSARTVTLTVAGKAALEHARAALAATEAMRQAVAEVTGVLRGRLTVGMVTGCTVAPLFDALAAFHRAHPGVLLTLREDQSDRLVEGVRAGTIDLALIGTADPPADLNAVTVLSEPLVALTRPEHPLAGHPAVALADLAGQPLVCMPAGTGIRTVLDRICAAGGVRAEVLLEASAADAVADLAARGLGVAILSESMAAGYADRLATRPISGADLPARLALVWSASVSPALDRLVRHGRAAFSVNDARTPAPD
ncbi:LysR family transcriptional regulator [Plantactinospora sp. GCM10030261]|uniref:LysR family transcriptional regulator n=1 Tax=Plantactinospora sp. GCM10030261 TaxID=3273420 RepID=UPI0036193AB0